MFKKKNDLYIKLSPEQYQERAEELSEGRDFDFAPWDRESSLYIPFELLDKESSEYKNKLVDRLMGSLGEPPLCNRMEKFASNNPVHLEHHEVPQIYNDYIFYKGEKIAKSFAGYFKGNPDGSYCQEAFLSTRYYPSHRFEFNTYPAFVVEFQNLKGFIWGHFIKMGSKINRNLVRDEWGLIFSKAFGQKVLNVWFVKSLMPFLDEGIERETLNLELRVDISELPIWEEDRSSILYLSVDWNNFKAFLDNKLLKIVS